MSALTTFEDINHFRKTLTRDGKGLIAPFLRTQVRVVHDVDNDGSLGLAILSRAFKDLGLSDFKSMPAFLRGPKEYSDAERAQYIAEYLEVSDKETSLLIFVDCATKDPILERLEGLFDHILFLDHHFKADGTHTDLSSRKYFPTYATKDECGASLAWKWCNPDSEMHELVSYVRDRDLWIREMRDNEAVSSRLSVMNHNHLEEWGDLLDHWSKLRSSVIEQGRAMVRMRKSHIERIHLQMGAGFYKGTQFMIMNSSIHQSDACNDALAAHPEAEFAVCWYMRADGSVRLSLRARTDENGEVSYNVGDVARSYGGGGHTAAAGCAFKSMDAFKDAFTF